MEVFIIGRQSKYVTHVKPKLDLIEFWRENGDTIEIIAKKLGIVRQTFYRYMDTYSELNKAIEKSREKLLSQLTKSLYKEATGYMIEEVSEEYIVDENGNKSAKKKIKKTTKFMRPSTSALIFAIKNLMPERFQQADKTVIIQDKDNEKTFTDETIQQAYNVLYGIKPDKKEQVEEQIKQLDEFGSDDE
jgi:hypothetical protein